MKNEIITYSVNKTKENNLYISVQNGEVTVRAPWYASQSKIQEAVANKREWILKKLNEYSKKENEISLKPIQIFGKVYALKVSYKNIDVIECNIEKNILKVNLPKKYKSMNGETITDILIDKMYMKIAEKELDNLMEKARVETGMAPEDYEIKEMQNCLAKVTENKKMYINPRIVRYSKNVIEYIIFHEFCHLKYKNHTKSFYNMLEKYVPNYKELEINKIKY